MLLVLLCWMQVKDNSGRPRVRKQHLVGFGLNLGCIRQATAVQLLCICFKDKLDMKCFNSWFFFSPCIHMGHFFYFVSCLSCVVLIFYLFYCGIILSASVRVVFVKGAEWCLCACVKTALATRQRHETKTARLGRSRLIVISQNAKVSKLPE